MGRVSRVLLGSALALAACLGGMAAYGKEAKRGLGHRTYKGVMVPSMNTSPRALEAARVGVVRVNAGKAQAPTRLFKDVGEYSARLTNHGIRPLPLLQQNLELNDRQWKRAVRAFAKGVPARFLEIGNEPGPEGQARYFQLARLAAPIIHAHNKKMILAAPMNVNTIAYLQAAKAAGNIFPGADGVAIHPYARTPARVQELVAEARKIVPDRLRLWITEVGWGDGPNRDGGFGGLDVTPKRQARYVANLYERLLPLGRRWNLASVGYYVWKDGGPMHKVRGHSGLIRSNGTRKPSYTKFRRRPSARHW